MDSSGEIISCLILPPLLQQRGCKRTAMPCWQLAHAQNYTTAAHCAAAAAARRHLPCVHTLLFMQRTPGLILSLLPRTPAPLLLQCRDHALSEHKTLKDILSDIDAMTVTSPGFNDKLKILMMVSTG